MCNLEGKRALESVSVKSCDKKEGVIVEDVSPVKGKPLDEAAVE